MKGALPYPFYSVKSACLEGIELVSPGFPSAYNPLMPMKLWRDTRPNLPTLVQYIVVQVEAAGAGTQKAVVVPMTISRAWAQSLNVPSGAASEGPAGEPELPFPVRALYEDEELAIGPGPMGQPVIRNKVLYAELTGGGTTPGVDLSQVIALLNQIIAALKKVGIEA